LLVFTAGEFSSLQVKGLCCIMKSAKRRKPEPAAHSRTFVCAGVWMDEKLRLKFRPGDLIAAAAVVLLAVAVALAFLPGASAGEGGLVQVYLNGEAVAQLPLQKNAELEIEGNYTNIITVQDGRAAITHSDCPGADCVHSGWISGPGRSIVCLPNRVEIRISGTSDVDFVVG